MEKIKENIPEEFLTAKAKYRDKVDLLLSRLSLLSGEDKLLMIMYWKNGNSIRQISRLAGADRRYVGRRIYKITERLMDGPYIDCLRYRHRFTIREMAIAKDYFLSGLSLQKIADKHSSSYYHVRQALQKIRFILENIQMTEGRRKMNVGKANADI